MGGGVFRVKFHPTDRNRIATANMYNGFATARIEGDSKLHIESVHTQPHESLAYGKYIYIHRALC
jgi:diphthine methyl ester acylhydrolase